MNPNNPTPNSRLTLILLLFLAATFAVTHFTLVETGKKDAISLEDRSRNLDDHTYYLHGALSIFDFEIEKKFNDKFLPFTATQQARPIYDSDMPGYAKYLLVFYPYPSFKFGYSLTAAVLSAPFPTKLFEDYLPRLVFVNILLMLGSLALIFFIVSRLTGSVYTATIAGLFYVFDVTNAHTAISYQSHTASGVFYILLAYYIYLKKPDLTPTRLGLIAFLLVFSLFSSSHTVTLAFFTGLFIFTATCLGRGPAAIARLTLAAIIGVSIVPAYIIGMELFFDFRELGLPTTFLQLEVYRGIIGRLISNYPLDMRFIWDFRLFNLFMVPILAITLFVALYNRFKGRDGGAEKVASAGRGVLGMVGARLRENRDYYILFFAVMASTAIAMFYSQPLSRSMSSFTVFLGLLFAIYLGGLFERGTVVARGLIIAILLLSFVNFYLTLGVIKVPESRPAGKIFTLEEPEVVYENKLLYYQYNSIAAFKFKFMNKGIESFVANYDKELSTSKDTYLEFDPSLLVTTYSGTHRLLAVTAVNPRAVANTRTFITDFRLPAEIFLLFNEGYLKKDDIIRKKKRIWPFGIWNSMYSYIFIYNGHIATYLTETPFNELDQHYKYYINYSALKEGYMRFASEAAAQQKGGQ